MVRVFVDSGSSIKESEKEKYNVEIIPLRLTLGEKEYEDGVNLDMDTFYKYLIDEKGFPKTSLPDLVEVEKRVNEFVEKGDDVIILTISSQISGTSLQTFLPAITKLKLLIASLRWAELDFWSMR